MVQNLGKKEPQVKKTSCLVWFGLYFRIDIHQDTYIYKWNQFPGRLHLREGRCQATELQSSLVHLGAINQLTNFWFCYFFVIFDFIWLQ